EKDAKQYPGHIRISTDFNDPLAHHIYGGSDIYLMPSRFEPCGLSQMIAMRYGAAPVVASTGGLRDTVMEARENNGTGFLFERGDAKAFMAAIERALAVYREANTWRSLQLRMMAQDFSWDHSVPKMLDVYRLALGRKSPKSRTPSKVRKRA